MNSTFYSHIVPKWVIRDTLKKYKDWPVYASYIQKGKVIFKKIDNDEEKRKLLQKSLSKKVDKSESMNKLDNKICSKVENDFKRRIISVLDKTFYDYNYKDEFREKNDKRLIKQYEKRVEVEVIKAKKKIILNFLILIIFRTIEKEYTLEKWNSVSDKYLKEFNDLEICIEHLSMPVLPINYISYLIFDG